jgi:hypothetical protein
MSYGQAKIVSHPPLRTPPPAEKRPPASGPGFYVDVQRGDDRNDGKETAPWRSIGHALGKLAPGSTLYLRGGVYYENVAVRLTGRAKAPITLRSYPGEQAIIDGSLREFTEKPSEAWEAFAKGGKTEYRSRRSYPSLRTVVGSFGDSLIGLQTYYHALDLRAENERWDLESPDQPAKSDVKPVYCGPGVWYDTETGHIHCRLAHTHLPGDDNYRGVTDPRQVPLILAPFRSVTLHIDGARHVRFQDLVIRGGGYQTVLMDQSSDIEFDNVTLWCGTYGMWITGTQRLKIHRCGFYGCVPPWTFRTDTSLRSYPERGQRDITRLGTHALLVPDGGREFSVYAFPINDDWDISYCDFTDGHDGIYLGGVNLRFHHNKVYDVQDDGIYLSPMYPRYGKRRAELHLYQNYLGRSLTALAFGGPEKMNDDTVYIYRNIIDLREPLATGRPSTKNPQGGSSLGKVMGDHGSPPWSAMKIYHNTVVAAGDARSADLALAGAAHVERPRFFFNNIVVPLARLPAFKTVDPDKGQADGNLYWSSDLPAKQAQTFFTKYRASALFEQSKKVYPPGFESHSLLKDPKFVKSPTGQAMMPDYRLQAGSPAVDAGVELPAAWPDPLRQADKGGPDIGALPLGAEPPMVGRAVRQPQP